MSVMCTSELFDAAFDGDIARMKRLLAQGADITERDNVGWGVLLFAAANTQYTAMQWLLTEAGASMFELGDHANERLWDELNLEHQTSDAAQLSSLLKIMVMLQDANADFVARVMPEHAELCKRGWQFRAQLPSYLEQKRVTIVTNCPSPAVLQSLVNTYAATTPEDMWADGLPV
jgi:hypothetical protein